MRWQYHFIRFLKDCEKGKPKQHPVGMTSVFNILNGSWATHDDALWDSPADWISPRLVKTGVYRLERFNPAKGTSAGEGRVELAGGSHQFKAPFEWPSVLYLRKSD